MAPKKNEIVEESYYTLIFAVSLFVRSKKISYQ